MGYFNDFCNLGYEGTLGHPSSVISAFRQLQEKARRIELEQREVFKARYEIIHFVPIDVPVRFDLFENLVLLSRKNFTSAHNL